MYWPNGKLGVSNERMRLLKDGQTYNFDDFSLAVVYADHSQLEPDAIGVVVETDGVRVYRWYEILNALSGSNTTSG